MTGGTSSLRCTVLCRRDTRHATSKYDSLLALSASGHPGIHPDLYVGSASSPGCQHRARQCVGPALMLSSRAKLLLHFLSTALPFPAFPRSSTAIHPTNTQATPTCDLSSLHFGPSKPQHKLGNLGSVICIGFYELASSSILLFDHRV